MKRKLKLGAGIGAAMLLLGWAGGDVGTVVAAETVLKASASTGESSSDWPQWRGPNRNGEAVNSPKLLDAWPKEGPKLLWKADFLHAGDGPGNAANTGFSGPVAAEGRVFVYVDWARNYIVTRKMLDDWGWMDGVPDELADKFEKARLAQTKDLAGADLEKAITDFLETLDPADAKKFDALVRKRLTLGKKLDLLGYGAATWESMAHVVGAGAVDRPYPTFEAWSQMKYNNKNIGGMLNSHGGPNYGANSMMRNVTRDAERTDVICCLDAATGRQFWRKDFPGAASSFGFYHWGGASGTPAVSNGKLYVAGSAGLYCLSVKDGKELWKVKTSFTSCSPLVANGMVYVIYSWMHDASARGGSNAEIKAFDAQTGALRWQQAKIGQTDGSPALWVHQGKSYIVIAAPGGLLCLDGDTGAPVWKEKSVNIDVGGHSGNGTPAVSGDIVLVQGKAAYRLTPQKAEVLWHDKRQERTDYGAAGLIDKGVAYYGSGYAPFQCIDMTTGQEKWSYKDMDKKVFCFAPILADGKIFAYSRNDMMLMLRASTEKHEELGAFNPIMMQNGKLSEVIRTIAPAIAGGRLYLRLRDHVVCYDLTEAGNP